MKKKDLIGIQFDKNVLHEHKNQHRPSHLEMDLEDILFECCTPLPASSSERKKRIRTIEDKHYYELKEKIKHEQQSRKTS